MSVQQILARLQEIEAKFPNYDRYIPKKWDTRIVCDREELIRSLRRCVLSAAEVKSVKFEACDGELQLSASSVIKGDSNDMIAVEIEGADASFSANADYIKASLLTAESERIACEVSKDRQQLIFREVDGKGPEHLYLVMMMR